MPTERPAARIRDVLTNIDAVERYTTGLTAATFATERMVVDAVERCLERLAEAVRKLGADFDTQVPGDVDLHKIRQFGNVLRHDYDIIDNDILWNAVTVELPKLKAAFETLQGEYPPPEKNLDSNFDPFNGA